ncbi:MAG: hypothetical protein J5858_03475 [Lentisphaeria bacterium]|nr:hypothetical protein [Lentisphaeria bacterium]
MTMLKRLAGTIALLLSVCALGAREYKVYQLSQTPVIDGKLDEYAWKTIPAGRGFRTFAKGYPFAKERFTSFKMGWRGRYLYLSVFCDEPDLKNLKAVKTYRDGWSFDDAIEMFFLPADQKKYMQLMVNANGALWTKRQDDEKVPEPPLDLKAASGRTASGWTIEMAIPLSFLGAKDVDWMRFNIARNAPGAGPNNGSIPNDKLTCWADVISSYAESARFAVMKKSLLNGTADTEWAEYELNCNYDRSLYLKLLEIARKGKVYKNLESQMGPVPEFAPIAAMQQKIAQTYRTLPKSRYASVLREWNNCVRQAVVPRRNITFSVKNDVPDLKVFVNGKAVESKNGRYSFMIEEGVSTICVSGTSRGGGLPKFDFVGLPDLNARWSYSAKTLAGWLNTKFDDRSWKAVPAKLPAGKFHLRQVVIWNQRHDGRMRCLNPTIHSWGFSKNSMEPLYLSLYSPTGLKVNSFDFIMDLPQGMRLMDMEPGARRARMSLAPLKVTSAPVSRDGKKFTRYTLTYNNKDIHEWTTADSILGIYKDGSGREFSKDAIYYSRRINGNVTEITGAMPVHILPPINGRVLKHMFMSYYMRPTPQRLSPEIFTAVVKDSVKAGVDRFISDPRMNIRNDITLKNRGKLEMGYYNHPIWGAKLPKGHVKKLLDDNLELYAVFFTGKQIFTQPANTHPFKLICQFCPSLTVTKYKEAFFKAVRDDYKEFFFHDYPDSEYIFLNWEQEPWRNTIYRKSTDPRKAYCFCALCKKNFRAFAKIPAGQELSNETIFKKYYEQWRSFRYSLDAQVHDIVVKAAGSLGKKIYFYSWSNHFGYWEAARNVPYKVFLGLPGNPSADRKQQISMDQFMKFHMGQLKRKNIVGQRFVFFPQTYGWNFARKEGWLNFNVMSDDGYIHPETWKWETIRILATLQGGLDYQNPLEMIGGIKYYVGEATRMIAEYEDIFYFGKRNDSLAESKEITYPDLLVLEYGKKRLVLAFNEGSAPKTVTIRNKSLINGAKAEAYYANRKFDRADSITLTIPPNDVEAICIEQ